MWVSVGLAIASLAIYLRRYRALLTA
jgi:hypothetical protein